MIEAKLSAALEPICPDAVFPDVAPANSVAPWITFQQYAGKDLSYIEQTLPEERAAAFQVTVWAKTRAESLNKALRIEEALLDSAMQVKPEGGILSTTDPDTGLRGSIQRFLIVDER